MRPAQMKKIKKLQAILDEIEDAGPLDGAEEIADMNDLLRQIGGEGSGFPAGRALSSDDISYFH